MLVVDSPVITCGNSTAYVGQRDVILTCLVQSQPPVTELRDVRWVVNGTILNELGHVRQDGAIYPVFDSTVSMLLSTVSTRYLY